ncbi:MULTISPECIES: PspC domain-containing protein [Gemella]|uniref:PspC domain-containing protein n=1 Tax=Gemella TaxID=1378 RepID=UPI0007681ED8|nr:MULTISPECIES: PspC domain-containing protein [Gemella]AME08860.1 PspC family transcriptional regulator [Gemella sp. oral taxon 928]AXI26431.1 PspC domain-containing protein [Gemella sp. ND 6198]
MINNLNKLWERFLGYLEDKKIYKEPSGAMIAGVCQGLSNRFGINITLLRVLWLCVSLISFGGAIVVYIILAMTLPTKPRKNNYQKSNYINGNAWEKK